MPFNHFPKFEADTSESGAPMKLPCKKRTYGAAILSLVGVFAVIQVGSIQTAAAQFGVGQRSNAGLGGESGDPFAARAESNMDDPKMAVPNIVLREGTLVGPVRGRLVFRGQRWRFIVKSDTTSETGQLSQLLDTGNARKITNERSSLLNQKDRMSGILGSNASGVRSLDDRAVNGGAIGQVAERGTMTSRVLLPAFDSMIVVENLMLGRIVSAIEEDSNDDHWTITGRITEFQEDNRLMLTTAHRAVSPVSR